MNLGQSAGKTSRAPLGRLRRSPRLTVTEPPPPPSGPNLDLMGKPQIDNTSIRYHLGGYRRVVEVTIDHVCEEKSVMAGETTITVIGNLTADPELRYTQTGTAVANFTVASTSRTFDRPSGQWKDGEALFLRCNIWRQAAENVTESFSRGDRVIVNGRLKQRSFVTREGEKRTVVELDVNEVGPSTLFATVTINKVTRNTAPDDPWGSAPPATEGELVGTSAGAPPF
jgi:single-strand DNA-binding protein